MIETGSASETGSQRWLVAIDGGGSKIAVAAMVTPAQAAQDNQSDSAATSQQPAFLSQARVWHFEGTGSAHPSTWPLAADNLCHALETVRTELASSAMDIGTVRLALAGAGRVEDQLRVMQTLQSRCPGLSQVPMVCTGDIDPLVDYQAAVVRGIAVILGTGSVVACRDESGQLVRAGGWGPLLGDACSGGAIGLSALRYLSQLLDEGQDLASFSELVIALVRQLRAIHPKDAQLSLASLLIQTASERTHTARLAGLILEHAYQYQTRAAQELLEPHLADIVWQIRQVARRAMLNGQPLQLNFTGGLAENFPALRAAIVEGCVAAGLSPLTESLVDPLEAILHLGMVRLA